LQGNEKLPGIVGRFRKTEQYAAGMVFTFNGLSAITFNNLKYSMLSMVTSVSDVKDNLQNQQQSKQNAQQALTRKVEEIQSTKDISRRCKPNLWCGFALLTGL